MTLKVKFIIGIAISLVFWYQDYKLEGMQESIKILSADNARLKIAVDLQKQTAATLETGLNNTIKLSNGLAKKIAKTNKERQVIIQKLNSYRGRLGNVTFKKPTLIERRATNATASLLQEFAKETGSKN